MEPRMPHSIPVAPTPPLGQHFSDSHVPYGRLQLPPAVLSIDRVRTTHMENDYIDNPALAPLAAQKYPRSPHEPPHVPRCEPDITTHPWISFSGRPSSISSSSSTSSDQRLLEHMAPAPVADPSSSRAVRIQPQAGTGKALDLKGAPVLPVEPGKHFLLCEACGRCKCPDCALPRPLPSCWVCHQECLCSAQSLVNCSTCMCLVRGLFYHCANEDDEGSCADHPCSCSHAHGCARWSVLSALTLLLPCLLCYPPAAGCVKLAQRCYDRVSRPGCRCKNANSVLCKTPLEGKVGGGSEKSF